MKQRNRILIGILLFLFIFSISIVLLSTWSLRRIYYASVENTLYLLSFIIEQHLKSEQAYEEQLVSELRQLSLDIRSNKVNLDKSLLSNTTMGIWSFSRDDTVSITAEDEQEDDIIRYYENNLSGRDSHARVVLHEEPYYLVHFQHSDTPLLILAKGDSNSGIRIHAILDSLVSSSTLIYFSILDTTETPIIYSSLYENFLPLVGTGSTVIKTPVGRIYHVEERREGITIVAGFTMNILTRITTINVLFLIIMTAAFIGSESVLLYNISRFERFRLLKEHEVKHFKEVSALSAGFTHEFRNSLNALSLLAKDIAEHDHKHILAQEITRMRTIMDSLKMTAHPSPSKTSLIVEDIVNESISLLQYDLRATDTMIQKELQPELSCHGNREMLISLFSNLLKNGIEAGATLITIISRKKGSLCEIMIRDDGAGLDTSLRERIFEPFFSNKQQTGLGLYLVKKIVELHGGSITVDSNAGTAFTIHLKRTLP
jgi:signal transduction histidine kinase